jgi:hypothetical protein
MLPTFHARDGSGASRPKGREREERRGRRRWWWTLWWEVEEEEEYDDDDDDMEDGTRFGTRQAVGSSTNQRSVVFPHVASFKLPPLAATATCAACLATPH